MLVLPLPAQQSLPAQKTGTTQYFLPKLTREGIIFSKVNQESNREQQLSKPNQNKNKELIYTLAYTVMSS